MAAFSLWICLSLLPLLPSSNAVGIPNLPAKTGGQPDPAQMVAIAPTTAPEFNNEVFRRQAFKTQCGFISADANDAFACLGGNVCVTRRSNVGCCNPTISFVECSIHTACLEYDAYTAGLCVDKGPSTRCCTNPRWGYCNTATYVDIPSQTLIYCAASHFGDPLYAKPTNTRTKVDDYPDPDEGAPVGVIVGGAIGGVALLVLIALCIIYCVMAKRKKEKERKIKECSTPPTNPPTPAVNSPSHNSVDHRGSTMGVAPESLQEPPLTYNNYSPHEGAQSPVRQPTGYVSGFDGASSEPMSSPHSPGFHTTKQQMLASAVLTPSPEPTWGTRYFGGTPGVAEISSEPIANPNIYEISGEERWTRQT